MNRVTLYRWVGSREQLLVDVIWLLAERTLEHPTRPRRRARRAGGERVIDAVITNPGMRFWLAEEGEAAMRLLTLRKPGYQVRLVAWHERLLRDEAEAGRLKLSADPAEVAYVIVRLIESYVYLDFITGEEPEPGRAEPILRMLLRWPLPANGSGRTVGSTRHGRRMRCPSRTWSWCAAATTTSTAATSTA